MIYSFNRPRCSSSSFLLIQSGIKGIFLSAFEQRVRNLKVGPLVHKSHFHKVMTYMALALQEVAITQVGGARYEGLGEGNYVSPTLFTDADNTMRIARG